jgi:hypothetical protein
MSKEQMDIFKELLATVKASQETSDMSWSTGNVLISLLRELQVA